MPLTITGQNGQYLGGSTTHDIGFHGATPSDQRANASQAAVSVTASTTTSPAGYSTTTQANAIVTLVNEIRATLVEKGLMKGSA